MIAAGTVLYFGYDLEGAREYITTQGHDKESVKIVRTPDGEILVKSKVDLCLKQQS